MSANSKTTLKNIEILLVPYFESHNVLKAIVFGLYARKTNTKKSDLDLILVMETGKGDLETARILLSNKRYAQACFHAQQAGEQCVRALWSLAESDPGGIPSAGSSKKFPGLTGYFSRI